MHALAKLRRQRLQRLAPGAGNGDCCALRVQGVRHGAAQAAGGACDKGCQTIEFKHGDLLIRLSPDGRS